MHGGYDRTTPPYALAQQVAHPGFTAPSEHLDALQRELALAAELQAAVPGILAHVNINGGCDSFDEAQANEYYDGAIDQVERFVAAQGTTDGARRGVSHETHRGRPLFHPTPTRRLLKRYAGRLRLTLDMSHWHVASERAPGYGVTTNRPEPEVLGPANHAWGAQEAAAAEVEAELPPGLLEERRVLHEDVFSAVEHIHSRIGTAQTAQTPPGEAADPNTLRAHVAMWRTVWAHMRASGAREALMTPEYGPGYFTGQSCVRTPWSPEQLWEQTLNGAAHMRDEFAAWEGGRPPTGGGPRPAE